MKKQPKAVSPKTRALMDEMAQDDSQSATTDQLDAIRDKMRVLRDMELEKDNITERLKQISESTRDLKERELVDMFDKAKIKSLGLPAEGNIPPFDLNLVPYYHANIGDSMPDDQRAKAFAWLDKKHPDMLRNTVTVSFGKGTSVQQKKLVAFMKKEKIEYSNKFGVPWNTLTAFVKEQIEEKKVTPPLELLGATVGRVVQVVKQKKEKK